MATVYTTDSVRIVDPPTGTTLGRFDVEKGRDAAGACLDSLIQTRERNVDHRVDALLAAGVPEEHILIDKVSREAVVRPMLDKLLDPLGERGELVVTRLKRIGRSQVDLVRGLSAAAIAAVAILAVAGCGSQATAKAAGGAVRLSGSDPASAAKSLRLPAPSGDFRLGTVALHLVDKARKNPFAAKSGPRELMVQLWYPAGSAGGRRAPYMDAGVAKDFEKSLQLHPGTLKKLRTHAREAAPAVQPDRGGFPVVLFSPGMGFARSLGTTVVEELASYGYVVAAVDHPYDAGIVEFPGGRLVRDKEGEDEPEKSLAEYDRNRNTKQAVAVRVADIRFVIDALQNLQAGRNPDADGRPPPENLAGKLDLSRLGMLGHSLGGATAAQVLQADARLRAAAALDGVMPRVVRQKGLNKPIMLMKSGQPGGRKIIGRAWKQTPTRAWHLDLRLLKSRHLTYTDFAFIAQRIGGKLAKALRPVMGSINGDRAVTVTRAYVTAFFDRHLKDQPQPLLKSRSPQYSEIAFPSR